jgi:putative acetyltransferase
VGGALMHAVIAAADALEYPVVVLLGHREYYPRFGFVPAADVGITPTDPAWEPGFQARILRSWVPSIGGNSGTPLRSTISDRTDSQYSVVSSEPRRVAVWAKS